MSASRHYSLDCEHNNNGQMSSYSAPSLPDKIQIHSPTTLSTVTTTKAINVELWLKKAKLSDYVSLFKKEKITIEELLTFTDSELKSVANETLHLAVLHKKRFMNAMDDTRRKYNNTMPKNSNNLYSLSSSQLGIVNRPLSPALSTHSVRSTHSSPMDSKYTHYNTYKPSTKKSPLITTNYNGHFKNYKHYKNANNKVHNKSHSHRFSKHRKRRHTMPDQNDTYFNSHSHSHSNSSATNNSLSDIESVESENNQNNGHQKQRLFKITRPNNKKNKKNKIMSATPTLTAVKPFEVRPKKSRNNSINIILAEEDENDTEDGIKRMSLNSSDDNSADMESSNNELHSSDEKWDELDLGTNAMSIEEKENIKTLSVLLQENSADMNQIENGTKILNNSYNRRKDEINEYFHILILKLNDRHNELLDTLLNVKNDKLSGLNKKGKILKENKANILKQKYLCDKLITDSDINGIGNKDRQIEIEKLKDNVLNDINNNDINLDFNDYESMIDTHFDMHRRESFLSNICVIKDCRVPHSPKIKVNAKHRNDSSIAIKVITMSTKEKKAILHYPHRNDTKNSRIHEIQIEYIQSKSSDIHKMYQQFNISSDSPIIVNTYKPMLSPRSRKLKRKLKVKTNGKKHKRKRKKTRKDTFEENEEKDESEMTVNHRKTLEKQTETVIIDQNEKIKRIHEVTLKGLLPIHNCFVRGRCRNINGWSEFSEPINIQLTNLEKSTLRFERNKSVNGFGIDYLMNDKCIVFSHVLKQHSIAVLDIAIDRKECDSFEWRYTLQFEEEMKQKNKKTKGKNKKKKTEKTEIITPSDQLEGVCMGFVGYPLSECLQFSDAQLGRNGTQYGLFVSHNSKEAHAYFTRDDSIHHTCAIQLNESVANNDQFRIVCNMRKGKCNIYHNNHLLMDIFNSKIPNKIIPAVSGFTVNGNVSCTVDFISSS